MQIGTCVSPLKQAAGLTRLPSPCRVNVARRTSVAVSAASRPNAAPAEVAKALAVSSVAASLMASGNAHAASELAAIAANDGRLGAITLLFLPALGWVAFNIFGPALNQLDTMKSRGVLAGLGLSAAALLAAQSADASELAQLAASDNRGSILFLLFVPALAWVGFNILGPALNQLDNMKKGAIAGAGLSAASLLAAQSADAAEIAQLAAAGDSRGSVLALLFVPALAWVGFNILGPALNQVDSMKNRGAIAGLGLSAAALLAAQSADAAEIAQLAAGDNRSSVLLLLFVPALAWVGFNILGPALNQVDNMRNK